MEWPGIPLNYERSPDWAKYNRIDVTKAHRYNLSNKYKNIQVSQMRLKQIEDDIGLDAQDLLNGKDEA